MRSLWEDIQYKVLQSGSRVNLLIGINAAVFLIFGLFTILEKLTTGNHNFNDLVINYLAVPANLSNLLTRFWTPFTYMFLHDGIFHILFNMLWLYWLGRIFEEYLSGKKLLPVYILGGLAGALLYIIAYNVFPLFAQEKLDSHAVGASAGVIAVVVATATLLPDYTIGLLILGPVKLKWIAVFYVVISFLNVAGPNAGGNFAHLGGALIGFLYVKQLRNGNSWGAFWNRIFKRKPKMRVVSRNHTLHTSYMPSQEEIDHILDKINLSGFNSLSKNEKIMLARWSDDQKKS
ncbi:MAG: rhomboid family intramembrane serine protease [Sphingobacteriaceae bacterium]